LIAEEVAKVNPELVLPDKDGKPYTVRYDAVNAMLLNEFLTEHRTKRTTRIRKIGGAGSENRAFREKAIEALTARAPESERQARSE